jgi:microcystin-dependent protein
VPSTFSPSLRLELIGAGEQAGIWNQTTNNNLGELLEQSIAGRTTLDVTLGNITLSSLNGVVDEARSAVLAVTGTPGVTRVLTIPNEKKMYTLINQTTNIVQVKTTSGAAFNCPPSATTIIACDGNDGVQGSGIAPLTSPAFTGIPIAPTAAQGTATTQLATTAFVTTAVAAGIPTGVITMWSGSIASIPSGWALCDGTGGRPDLRDRFIVGAGTSYVPGNTGGANTVTLDVTQIPSHTHTGLGTTASANVEHTHSGTSGATDLSHSHTGSGTSSATSNDHTHSGTTGNQSNGHTHTGSGTSSAVSNDHTHSGSTGTESASHFHGVSGSTSGQNVGHTHTGTTTTVGDHAHAYSFPLFGNGQDESQSIPSASDNFNPGRTYSSTTAGAGAHNHTFTSDGVSNDHVHTFNVNSGGISNNHTHAFSTGGQSANHTHTYSFTTSDISANHNHAFSTGGQSANHTHTYSFTTSTFSGNHTHPFTTGAMSANADHSHTFSFTSAATGGGLAHENRPPYFALAFIIKT